MVRSDDRSTCTTNNNDMEYMHKLQFKLDEILQSKELTFVKEQDLIQKINARESEQEFIERSLGESRHIAADIERRALIKARNIMAEAENVAGVRKAQVTAIEQEIATIKAGLSDHPAIPADIDELGNSPGYAMVEGSHSVLPESISPYSGNDSFYNMQLVAFVNARHFVTFGGKDGPIHAHSWQAQIEVEVPAEKGEVMGFAEISSAIAAALAPYENTVLNYTHPFNIIQPTTENIAMYFFNCLDEVLLPMGLRLAVTTLWETPTRGIRVSTRNIKFDDLIKNKVGDEPGAREIEALAEQAAAADQAFKERISHMFDKVKVKRPLRVSLEWAEGSPRPQYPLRNYVIGFVLISIVAFLVYHRILFPSFDQRFPWGSDSWGHLFKADYLYHEILKGNYYPQFTEYWYNGTQPFRYWAPLPYYVLAGLEALTGDIFTAGNLYVFLCALGGGLSWLLLARWMGMWPAVMAGAIWVSWQENLLVAFSEGNLPRVLATALLPLLLAVFLRTLGRKKTIVAVVSTAVIVHLVVLSHAMLGAVYCIGLFLFAFFLWIFGGCRLKDFVWGISLLLISLATSAWWLLPGLTGGISGIDADAVKEAVRFTPALVSLNPLARFSDRETFYWGISVVAALAATLVTWRSKPPWAKSMTMVGTLMIIMTFPIMRPIYLNLPLGQLLWPVRFSSFAIMAVLMAALGFNTPEHRQPMLKSSRMTGIVLIGIFIAMFVDCWFSMGLLVHTATKNYDIQQSAQILKKDSAWREATIDLSELGSAPSYIFSEAAGLEQVFGWAWQGAVTSRNIMLLNTGLEMQYYPFLFRSSIDMGATDLVVKDDVVKDPAAFGEAAKMAGYKYRQSINGLSLWHSVDQPYLVVKKPDCLVIGRYAGTVALQFPGVEMGFSNEIDQYSAEYLKGYAKIVLSGAKWSSKSKTEKLLMDYVASGGKLIVELSGMPENILAKQPELFGVYGEAVILRDQFVIQGEGKSYELEPPPADTTSWKAYVPMGLDQVDMVFSYYGNQAPVFGYKLVNGNKVWFLGGNLTYQSYMTGDPVAFQVLKDTLGMDGMYPAPQLIPVQNYQASENGYAMAYESEKDIEAIVPIAAIEGFKVTLDGVGIPSNKFENLLRLRLPAGSHRIEIKVEKTPVYQWGMLLSLFSLLALVAFTCYMTKRTEVRV